MRPMAGVLLLFAFTATPALSEQSDRCRQLRTFAEYVRNNGEPLPVRFDDRGLAKMDKTVFEFEECYLVEPAAYDNEFVCEYYIDIREDKTIAAEQANYMTELIADISECGGVDVRAIEHGEGFLSANLTLNQFFGSLYGGEESSEAGDIAYAAKFYGGVMRSR